MYCCDFDDNKICLPDTVQCEDYNDADSYFDQLYTNIFLTDFITSRPSFKNKPVYIRKEPKYESWEHGDIVRLTPMIDSPTSGEVSVLHGLNIL